MTALLQNRIVQQVLKSGAGTAFRLASVGSGMLFAILGARFIGAEDFGHYVSLMAIMGLITTASTFGLPSLLTREVAIARGETQKQYIIELQDWIVLTTLLLFIGLVASWLFLDRIFALAVTFMFLSNISGIMVALLMGYERVLTAAGIRDVGRPFFALLLLIGFGLLNQAGVETLFIAQIAGAGLAVVLCSLALGVSLRRRGRANFRWPVRFGRSHMNYAKAALTLGGAQLLIASTTQVDILVLTWLANPTDVAHYYAAARAALIVSFFYGINCQFAEPELGRLVASDKIEEARTLALRTMRSGFVITLFAAGGAVALGGIYLRFFGPDFIRAYSSLALMVCGLIVWSAFGPAQVMLRATRKDGALLLITGVSVIINIVVSCFLVPRIGMFGAAIGTTVQYVVYGAMMSVAAFKLSHVSTDLFSSLWIGKAS